MFYGKDFFSTYRGFSPTKEMELIKIKFWINGGQLNIWTRGAGITEESSAGKWILKTRWNHFPNRKKWTIGGLVTVKKQLADFEIAIS